MEKEVGKAFQLLAISLDLRLLAFRAPASRPAQIVTPPELRASNITFTETQQQQLDVMKYHLSPF
jgi:hypothetical protein